MSSARSASNIDFIKQTADPRNYFTRPAPNQHPVAMMQQVNSSLNFEVYDLSAATTYERVPSDTGLFLWFPKDGVESLYHMAIVPQGASSYSGDAGDNQPDHPTFVPVRTILSENDYSRAQANDPDGYGFCGIGAFYYRNALAIPRSETSYSPVITPQLAKTFTRTRGYGGLAKLWANTINANNAILNGSVSTAVISDTRDLCQNSDGNDCFSTTDLVSQARNVKEYVDQVNATDGVLSLQGPDISIAYTQPDMQNVVQVEDAWQSLQNVPAAVATVPATTGWSPSNPQISALVDNPHNWGNIPIPLYTVWASPWGVAQLQLHGQSPPDPTSLFNTQRMMNIFNGQQVQILDPLVPGSGGLKIDPLNEDGFVDVKFNFTARVTQCVYDGSSADPNKPLNQGAGQADCPALQCRVVIDHWFAQADNAKNGTIKYNVVHSVKTINENAWEAQDWPCNSISISTCGAPSFENRGALNFGFETDISEEVALRGGLKGLGKFIGFKIQVLVWGQNPTGNNTMYTLVPVSQPTVQVRARQIYATGKLGPCHVLRYDQIGKEQLVRFESTFNTESVPKGSIAPYVKDAMLDSKYTADTNIYSLLYALYMGKTPFKCSWSIAQWTFWIQTMIKTMSQQTLEEMLRGDFRAIAAGESAAVVSNNGNVPLLTSLLGQQGELLGSNMMHTAQSEALTNPQKVAMGGASAGGQFGGAGAWGQFGGAGAGGQFGASSGGQFGADSAGFFDHLGTALNVASQANDIYRQFRR